MGHYDHNNYKEYINLVCSSCHLPINSPKPEKIAKDRAIMQAPKSTDNNITKPVFNVHVRFQPDAGKIYTILKELSYTEHVSQLISEFAATQYLKCMNCQNGPYGFIECCYDYYMINAALANYDQNDEIRYYLNRCDDIDQIWDSFDIDTRIICEQCAISWQCSVCLVQCLSDSHESILVNGGCDNCGCIICEDCVFVHNDKILCGDCYEVTESDTDKQQQGEIEGIEGIEMGLCNSCESCHILPGNYNKDKDNNDNDLDKWKVITF